MTAMFELDSMHKVNVLSLIFEQNLIVVPVMVPLDVTNIDPFDHIHLVLYFHVHFVNCCCLHHLHLHNN